MDFTYQHSKGIQISPAYSITNLEYAGDVLFADSYNEMQRILNNVSVNKCS